MKPLWANFSPRRSERAVAPKQRTRPQSCKLSCGASPPCTNSLDLGFSFQTPVYKTSLNFLPIKEKYNQAKQHLCALFSIPVLKGNCPVCSEKFHLPVKLWACKHAHTLCETACGPLGWMSLHLLQRYNNKYFFIAKNLIKGNSFRYTVLRRIFFSLLFFFKAVLHWIKQELHEAGMG